MSRPSPGPRAIVRTRSWFGRWRSDPRVLATVLSDGEGAAAANRGPRKPRAPRTKPRSWGLLSSTANSEGLPREGGRIAHPAPPLFPNSTPSTRMSSFFVRPQGDSVNVRLFWPPGACPHETSPGWPSCRFHSAVHPRMRDVPGARRQIVGAGSMRARPVPQTACRPGGLRGRNRFQQGRFFRQPPRDRPGWLAAVPCIGPDQSGSVDVVTIRGQGQDTACFALAAESVAVRDLRTALKASWRETSRR